MNRNRSLWCAAVVMCVFAAPCLYAQSDASPSLGEVARQRSSVKARHVVTNDEIPPSPEADLAPDPATTAAGGSAKAGAALAAKKGAAKTNLPADKQAQLQALVQESDSLQQIIKRMQGKIAETNDPLRISTLSDVVRHAKDALAEDQAAIEKLKAAGAAGGRPVATEAASAMQSRAN